MVFIGDRKGPSSTKVIGVAGQNDGSVSIVATSFPCNSLDIFRRPGGKNPRKPRNVGIKA